MRHKLQIIMGIPLLVVGLGSTLLLQEGYAQTWQPDSLINYRLETVKEHRIQFDPQPENMVIRLGVQSEEARLKENGAKHSFRIAGIDQLCVYPDQAVVRLAVQTEAKTAVEALTQNRANLQNLLNAVDEAGIPGQAIHTHLLQLQPHYEEQNTRWNPVKYIATTEIEIRLRNLNLLNQLLNTAARAGARISGGVSFEVSDPLANLSAGQNVCP